MSSLTHTLADSSTMLRRNLLHARRYPSLTLVVAAVPIIFLLVFVFVLGDTLGAGLGGSGGRGDYLEYVVPGILLMGIAGGAQGTAIGWCLLIAAIGYVWARSSYNSDPSR